MALVAKMHASNVQQSGGGRWVACDQDDPDAKPVSEAPVSSMYGIPFWLQETGFVKYLTPAQSQESFCLTAVSTQGDPDDPNRDWAMASPSGELKMSIQNPAGFGYVEAGREYRVTIERIRGPRDQPGS